MGLSNPSGSITGYVQPGTISQPFGSISTQFNPAWLFLNGEAGFFGDTAFLPNNFTTATGSTKATTAGDPLGRIVRIAGSLNLTQGTDANRPTLGSAANHYLPLFDGTNDFLTTGVQSFGNASLFADAGQSWTTWVVFRTSTFPCQMLTKRNAASGAGEGTFAIGLTSVTGTIQILLRDASNAFSAAADDNFHIVIVRWDGSAATTIIDNDAIAAISSVGTGAETAANILVGARNESAPAGLFNGDLLAGMIDRALTDAEMNQLAGFLNNLYR